MRPALASVAALVLLFTACSKTGGSQSRAAVQAGIEAYLRQRPNVVLNNMTMQVQDVKFSGETAEAQVKFSSKQSPDLAVSVRYVLRRAGDGWEVQSSTPVSGMGIGPHGSAMPPTTEPQSAAPEPRSSH